MSFRARLALVAAVAVAVAVVGASVVVWFLVRGELYSQVDKGLKAEAATITHGPPPHLVRGVDGALYLDLGPGSFARTSYVQLVRRDGKTFRTFGERVPLPVGSRTLAVARGSSDVFFANETVARVKLRVLTFGGEGYALQLARSLSDTDKALRRIKLLLLVIGAGGVAIAAALGLLVSRAAVAPVRRLTDTTERVTQTGDLSQRIEGAGRDELGRLAGSFNAMLAALEDSTRAQRQLVADASHELRTPLTSLRTNIEVLASDRTLPPGERERLLRDVVEQLGEMTTLVAELIQLARGDAYPEPAEDVRLDLLVADAVERARRNRPGVTFDADLEESLVHAVPARLERAVANLLDNAAKWSPPGGQVDVRVEGPRVVVRDHGPGIAEEDLPHVFDRFYRAPSARGMPGSGLGLAIVRQVAETHGGTVVAERADGGGTRMIFDLDGASTRPDDSHDPDDSDDGAPAGS